MQREPPCAARKPLILTKFCKIKHPSDFLDRHLGNENWEFKADGLMRRRIASINDLNIEETGRTFRWPAGIRPADHPGLSQLGL